jgi:hypothetical protein
VSQQPASYSYKKSSGAFLIDTYLYPTKQDVPLVELNWIGYVNICASLWTSTSKGARGLEGCLERTVFGMVWNTQSSRIFAHWYWRHDRFYVNLKTNESTWEKPTEPAKGPNDATPADAPPGYTPGGDAPHSTDEKKPLDSNNPFNGSSTPSGETDDQIARRMQQEEASRGQADGYYGQAGQQQGQQYPPGPQHQSSYDQNQLPPRPQDGARGLFSKILGKGKSSGGQYPQQYGSPGPQYGGGYGGPPPGQYGGGYPQGPGYGPPPGMYGQPPMGYGQPPMGYGQPYGGYPQQGYGGRPMMGGGGRRPGGGMGAGGMALGVGGGLLGGALLANAINDGEQDAYQDGYQDGADDGGGGDFDGGE